MLKLTIFYPKFLVLILFLLFVGLMLNYYFVIRSLKNENVVSFIGNAL